MSNPLVQKNITMEIRIPKQEARYIYFPYWLESPMLHFSWKLDKSDFKWGRIDRRGIWYNLSVYFTIIESLQASWWFQGVPVNDWYGIGAHVAAAISQLAGIGIVSFMVSEWQKKRDL